MARYSAAGTVLERSTDGVSYTTVPNVRGVNVQGGQKQTIDATCIDDVAVQEVDGLPNFGSAQITIAWDPDNSVHQALRADYEATNVSRYFRIKPPNASSTVGNTVISGPVVGWEGPNYQPGSIVEFVLTVKVNSMTIATS